MNRRIAWILWPSFLAAIPAVGVVFSFIDPVEVMWLWGRSDAGRLAAYTLGFLFFWGLGALSSALTCLLNRSPYEVNRCTLEAHERPPGCPKRAAGECLH